jgi:hypothetical protein
MTAAVCLLAVVTLVGVILASGPYPQQDDGDYWEPKPKRRT